MTTFEGHKTTPDVQGHLISLSLKYGIIAGALIVIYFLIMHLVMDYEDFALSLGVRYVKFAILAIVIYFALKDFKYNYAERFKFGRSILLAAGISAIAATLPLIAELITAIIAPEKFFQPFFFDIEGEGFSNSRLLNAVLAFFETPLIGTLIIGLGITFLFQRKVEKDIDHRDVPRDNEK